MMYVCFCSLAWSMCSWDLSQNDYAPGAVLRHQRNRTGRPLSPPKWFIKRSLECWATSTKQLMNAGRGHQAPRKAAHSLQKEVGQNIKDKKRDKELGTETCPREGVMGRRRSFQTPGNPLTSGSVEEFWNLRGQHNQWMGGTHRIKDAYSLEGKLWPT